MEEVRLHFVIPSKCSDENDCSEEMQQAFVICEQNSSSGLQAQWIHESKCPNLDKLTKKDVFVLNEFKGELFDRLRASNCFVIGPRCLSCCWTEGCEIPCGVEPVFTIAMRGLKVTASGFIREQKESIKEKVCWMGGKYVDKLSDDVTHLVCDKALSDKYCKAAEKGIPIMCESWVEAVWQSSLTSNVNGASPQFDSHRAPVFRKLHVTCTGLGRREKESVMKLINEHGGIFTGAFKSESTDIIILNRAGLGSQKHKAALEFNKHCVLPTWVTDSVDRGHAQPLRLYKVSGASTSSPLSGAKPPDMSLNFSKISNVRPLCNNIDETQSTEYSMLTPLKTKTSQDVKKPEDTNTMEKDLATAIDNFDVSQIKNAGPLFDGFCIYVCGLDGVARERVCAALSRCGGVRYDSPHERVTHALAGARTAALAARAALPAVPVLSPLWLIHSIQAHKVLDEREYLINESSTTVAESSKKTLHKQPAVDASSPMSKRNLQLLRPGNPADTPRPPVPKFHLNQAPDEPDDESIMKQYLAHDKDKTVTKEQTKTEQGQTKSNITSTTNDETRTHKEADNTDEPTEEVDQIFAGMRIELQCIEESSVEAIVSEVERLGGKVVSGGAGGDYVIVPLDFDTADVANKDAQVVTVFWLRDCLSQNILAETQYYHRPVCVDGGSEILSGVVLSISTYSGVERMFLDELAQLLGATSQMRFCRRTTATTVASTHLLCPEASGDKYAGAVKWGLPAVRGAWLLACAAAGRRVREADFIVGDTKPPVWTDSMDVSVEPETTAVEKENDDAVAPPPAETTAPRTLSAGNHGTPVKRIQTAANVDADMSPASRYIAMARQGLLSCDSQDTPKRISELKRESVAIDKDLKTPPLGDALATPNLNCLSPTTRRRLQAIKRGEMPSGPIRTPNNPFEKAIPTPDSSYGALLRPQTGRLSPESRKHLYRFVQELPGSPQPREERKETPLSEICNRYLERYNPNVNASRKLNIDDHTDTPPSKVAKTSVDQRDAAVGKDVDIKVGNGLCGMEQQLQQLSALVEVHSSRVRRSSTAHHPAAAHTHYGEVATSGPDSQVNTVGWDDTSHQLRLVASNIEENAPLPPASPKAQPKPKVFVICSNVENVEELSSMIVSLGGSVWNGEGLESDTTHVLCAALSRSERTLSAVAGGKWLLHPSYVVRSHTAAAFLPEEDFEWGNEKARSVLPALDERADGMARAGRRWRLERAAGRPGPFHAMRVVLHMPSARKCTLQRLLHAGGATVLADKPPYSCEDATHCFADSLRLPLEERDLRFFAQRDIPVCPPIFITNYLGEDKPNARENCIPDYQRIYNSLNKNT